ncbi:OmpP1/FadL family transporter [Petrachloros mirabilis]
MFAKYRLILALAFGSLLLFPPTLCVAQALRFQPQGASAAGLGNAFAAQADDASAIHFNPAGVTQVDGIQVYAGTALMGGAIKYTSSAGIDTRGDFGGSVVSPPPSHTYITANLASLGWRKLADVTVGIGLTTPFGLNTRYPVDGPFNTAVTSATLPLIDIKPTVAYKLNDSIAVGLSADIYTFASFLGEGHIEQRFVLPGGMTAELNGRGTGAGFTASLLYTPLRNDEGKPLASIGLVYTSQSVIPLSGGFFVNGAKVADATANLVLPQIYRGGVAVWPIRDRKNEWKLELDVEYVGWKSLRNLDVSLSNGAIIPQPQQWKTVPVIAVGTEYKWLEPQWLPQWEIAVRSGYTRTENPVPAVTFNPAVASLSAHTISLGGSVLCKGAGRFAGVLPCSGKGSALTKAIGLDVAYQAWIYEPFLVTGNLNPTVNGTYHAYVHVGVVSFKFQF